MSDCAAPGCVKPMCPIREASSSCWKHDTKGHHHDDGSAAADPGSALPGQPLTVKPGAGCVVGKPKETT